MTNPFDIYFAENFRDATIERCPRCDAILPYEAAPDLRHPWTGVMQNFKRFGDLNWHPYCEVEGEFCLNCGWREGGSE